jgi:hypothetical protein
MPDCIVMGRIFYLMGDATVIDEALDVAEIKTIAIWASHSTRLGCQKLRKYLTTWP